VDNSFSDSFDGAAGIGWPIPSQNVPGFIVLVQNDGIIDELNVSRLKVVYECEEQLLSKLFARFLEIYKDYQKRMSRGWFADTTSLSMMTAWKSLCMSKGLGWFRLKQAKMVWAPNTVEHYFSIISEYRPLTYSKDPMIIFPERSLLKNYLLHQQPGVIESNINKIPSIAAFGFALEALGGEVAGSRTVRGTSSVGWT
jgi:hypothetical protein